MSRDFAYVFLENDLDKVRYSEAPESPTEQHLRLITGSLSKYLIGLSWHLNGYTSHEINEQWDWGADWNYNQQFGHAPDENLLLYGRIPSALMLAGAVWALFSIAKAVGTRPVAYLATAYFALNPAILLDGRRAMFEGGLLLFSLCTVLAAIWFLRYRSGWLALLLGLLGGLGLSAKHTAIFTVAAVFLCCGAVFIWEMFRMKQDPAHNLLKLLMACLVTGVIFWIINPIWWDDPIVRVGQVMEARSGVLEGQISAFGTYDGFTDQISGFLRQVFVVFPQYFEVEAWEGYIADQIARYESSPWRGISIGGSVPGAVIVAILVLFGMRALVVELMQNFRSHRMAALILGVWGVVMLLTSGILVPIEWQRYFLLAYPATGIFASLGFVSLFRLRRDLDSNTAEQPGNLSQDQE